MPGAHGHKPPTVTPHLVSGLVKKGLGHMHRRPTLMRRNQRQIRKGL